MYLISSIISNRTDVTLKIKAVDSLKNSGFESHKGLLLLLEKASYLKEHMAGFNFIYQLKVLG